MNLIDLEAFVSVVDHKSVVGAASALHLTQSAVTRRVQNLEEVLGVPLLDRQSRPLQPTSAGKETYEFARPVLNSVGDLKAAIMHNGEPSGTFRFGVARGLGDLAIAFPIRCLRDSFSKLKLHAFVQWSALLLERLANGSLDAAVAIFAEDVQPPATVNAIDLGTKQLQVVASKDTHFSAKVSLQELSNHPWVLNPAGCATRECLERTFLRHGLPFESTVEAEGYELQFSLIASGIGLGACMVEALHHSAFRKQIKVLKTKDPLPTQRVWLLYSKHIGRLEPVIDCLRGAINQSLRS